MIACQKNSFGFNSQTICGNEKISIHKYFFRDSLQKCVTFSMPVLLFQDSSLKNSLDNIAYSQHQSHYHCTKLIRQSNRQKVNSSLKAEGSQIQKLSTVSDVARDKLTDVLSTNVCCSTVAWYAISRLQSQRGKHVMNINHTDIM